MTDLEKIILQAERLKINLEAQELYKKNMAFLKESLPALYSYYKDYSPVEMVLAFDDRGDINIQNQSGSFVYPENPKEYADKQYSAFCNRPHVQHLTFKDEEGLDTDYIHQKLMQNLIPFYDEVNKYAANIRLKVPENLQTVIVLGLGLGYHIENITNNHHVRNLCIYDPHPESFYLSLHTIDWTVIISKFQQPGFNIEFCIGKKSQESFRYLTSFFARIGMYNIVVSYVYKHYESSDMTVLYEMLENDLMMIALGIGFYDDERVGLAHTIENYFNKLPIARRSLLNRGDVSNRTVVIVGNGPSLDSNESFLRSVSGKACLISCGTALATLEKKGIKPDIHVEQERNYNQYDWISGSTSEEFRKGIKLVTLNTGHPKVPELFEESYSVIKPNDLGGNLLISLLDRSSGHSLVVADFCNPTVTNFATSFAVTLGFKNIILVGVDLGMPSPEKHHSIDSAYYEQETDWEDIIQSNGLYEAPGNFQEKIWTNNVWDRSRVSFEQLLHKYRLNCVNVNDGLKIKNTISCRSEDIEIAGEHALTLKDELEARFKKIFYLDGLAEINKDDLRENVEHVSIVLDRYRDLLKRNVSTLDDVYILLREAHYFIKGSKDISFVAKGLLKGTLEYISCTLISVLCVAKEEDIADIFSRMVAVINCFFDEIEVDAKENIFKLDEFTNYC
ncbi:6-hydroxymethylpterin diphosphokinase MptE-like protein [Neptuniibacter sp. QD37_6]|uniref:motility associated factor glycosyltransferase family protein n=1 Tax=Neptuniibacter sp. QD37_6 TaxID=3398210 RepID=UPI0039F4D6CF